MTKAIILISVFVLIELIQITQKRNWINVKINSHLINVTCILYQMSLTIYMLFTYAARTSFEWNFFLIAIAIPFAEYLFLSENTEQ